MQFDWETNKVALAKAKLTLILLTALAFAVAGVTYAAITINQNIPSAGTITTNPNVEIYSNSQCTNSISTISWGSIEAGGNTQQTIYVEDTGDTPMTLSITVSSWSPSTACNYITLSWNWQGQQIQPGANNAIPVTFTLNVSPDITGITTFSNSITISGTG